MGGLTFMLESLNRLFFGRQIRVEKLAKNRFMFDILVCVVGSRLDGADLVFDFLGGVSIYNSIEIPRDLPHGIQR